MEIANPIYDVVFKYLMNDNEVAKLIISTIIEEEILELKFLPQEGTLDLQQRSLTVYILDFSAKIKIAEDEYKNVLIEIQKAKFATDIMRFRRYLGSEYQKKENTYSVEINGEEVKKAMPILSIYFLGYKLDNTTAPIIKVARHYYDLTTGKEINIKEEFIESLTHDSLIIQIPYLAHESKTEIEQMLSIFDQSKKTGNSHILNIKEDDYPEKYREVIRRLQRAIAEPEVRKTMDIEDEILEELQNMEREIEIKDKALEAKDKALESKDKALEAKDKALEAKDKIIEELRKKLSS